jgi:serine/threonine-protein kinase
MSGDSKAMPTVLTASEFVSALEQSGVVPEGTSRELRLRLASGEAMDDASTLARRLVDGGELTAFQARRLLRGKAGLVLGRYVLLERIGQGARGRVFKARHRLMDRVVALKVVILDESVSHRSVARFFREMKIAALLDHPNVVRAIDADEHEGWPYIVMEFLQGQDLGRVFTGRGPLAPGDVIDYMAQAARGLAHAHEQGVIHRDIKPTNLFLLDTGIVKVLDLGLGELIGTTADAGNIFDTDEGVVVGTTDFMSPEQVRSEPIDARSDLFSLGCTMYRLLTGTYAFPGLTREDRLIKRIRGRHVPITDVRPALPQDLARIVDRLLAIRADDRFASAGEVADALEGLLPPSPRPGSRAGAGPGMRTSAASTGAVDAESEPPIDWSRIESALGPGTGRHRPVSRRIEEKPSRPPSTKGLSSHRKALEDDGDESGREAHAKYRGELIQMNRVMAELRALSPPDETPVAEQGWLERAGEKLGDLLSEPSAGQIVIAILLVLLVLALALAYALGS